MHVSLEASIQMLGRVERWACIMATNDLVPKVCRQVEQLPDKRPPPLIFRGECQVHNTIDGNDC